MKCPVDNTTLSIADRQGIEIDFCPACRGVWLDRGELDKLIERSNAALAVSSERHRSSYPTHPAPAVYRKKKSVWGEIFDF